MTVAMGKTKRRLKDRFNEHRRLQLTNLTLTLNTLLLPENFLSNINHSNTRRTLIPLEIIHTSRDSRSRI